MLPVKDAVESASTHAQVLQQLSSFLDDLRRYYVDAILPQRYSELAARNPDEVRAWAAMLGQECKDAYSLSAAGRYWSDEVRDAFGAAARRLDEISAAEERPASGLARIAGS